MPLRPLSGVLAQEYGGGRRQQVQREQGRVWHKARGGETEASGDLEVSVVGQQGLIPELFRKTKGFFFS